MSQAKQLHALQEIDLELEKKKGILSQVESQIGESQAVKQAQDKLESERKQLAELENSQKELGWQLDDLQEKSRQSTKKLYGGSVKNPKELTSLQDDVDQLKTRQGQTEEKLLETMMQIESAQERIRLEGQELERLQAEWQQSQQQLASQQLQLQAEIDRLAVSRQALASTLLPAAAELYDTLRRGKQGRAIAKVEQGRCQGCRLSLSVTDLRRARVSTELVYCSSCGRILFLD